MQSELGGPGDLVIQDRFVALTLADFLGTKVQALFGSRFEVVRAVY